MDANVNIGLNVDSSGAERSVGSLKSQLRAAQAEVAALSDKFGATSVEAANAARKAAEIADAIGDAKRLTDAFNPDAKFTALTRSFGGVLNGFQAFQGALGTLGVESEDLQRQLLKVQSAMALSQGLQGLFEAKDDFKILGSVIKNTVVSAFTTLRGAIIATGLGALAVVVGYLVNEFLDMAEAEDKAAEKQKKLNEEFGKQAKFVADESSDFRTLITRLKDSNQGSKERKDLIKKINDQYGTTLTNMKSERDFQEQVNTELRNYIAYSRERYYLQSREQKRNEGLAKAETLQNRINQLKKQQNELEKKGALQMKDGVVIEEGQLIRTGERVAANKQLNEQYLEGQKEIDNLQKALENTNKNVENYEIGIGRAADNIDKLTQGGTKYGEQTTKTTEEVTQAISLQNDIIYEKNKRLDEGLAKELTILEETKRRRIQEINDTKADEEEKKTLLKEVELTYQEDVKDLKEKYTFEGVQYATKTEVDAAKDKSAKLLEEQTKAEELAKQQHQNFLDKIKELDNENTLNKLSDKDREIQIVKDKYAELEALAKDNAEQLKIIAEAKGNEIDAINQKYNQKEIDDAEKVNKAKMSMAADSIGGLVDLIVMFGADNEKNARKQFEINKKASIANAVINTFKAVTNALASDPPPFSYINAGIAAFTGMAQVTKIKNTKFEAPQDVEKPPAGTPPAAPENMGTFQPGQFTTIGSTKSSSGSGGKSTKVYVLESDITQVQRKVSVIESRSILGG